MSRVVVPTAVAAELAEGRRLGLDLPTPENLPWVDLREAPVASLLPLVAALGPGETAVLALALAAKSNPMQARKWRNRYRVPPYAGYAGWAILGKT